MNAVGRQMQRSGSTGHHHQRQYSETFLEPSNYNNNKWLQSAAGLHHLHSSNSTDFGIYGNNGVDGSRLSKNGQRIGNGGSNEDPSTPPVYSRSSSLRNYGGGEQVSPSKFSPGLLDLNSFDTELLPEVHSKTIGHRLNQPFSGQGFDNPDPYSVTEKLSNSARGLSENNLLKSFSVDKERASNVAKIKVVVRKRPLNRKEIAKKEEDIISISPNTNSLVVHETKLKVDLTEYVEKHGFMFDAVMDEDVSNDEIYSQTVEPIVPIIFQRTKATCFAYGQTGSGKTYTMQPLPIKASQDIFKLMHHNYRNQGFQLHVSFFEIYGGKVFDLLNDRKKLCMREDGKQQVCIVGLQEYWVSNVETVKELIERGNATRSTGTTGANEESSRSHAILQLAIKRFADGNESKPARVVGKLSFIDLAGSERGADTTDNDKQTRMEGAEINKSLLALKECIRALDNDQGHIPFRGSKLTEVLRDSFVGDSRTVMISCISPSSGSCEHTLNTLRYADRVKSLSKGSSSRKDPSSLSLNLRSSVSMPLSSVSPTLPSMENNKLDARPESNRFGWSKQVDREPSQSFNIERVPSGRIQSSSLSTVFTDDYNSHTGLREETMEDDFEYPEETFKPRALESNMPKHSTQIKPKDMTSFAGINSHSDDDLNALLEEEEDLLIAHRKQVEETMEIVKEEMKLLVEVDEPGNQLDEYISKLNAILSKKAVAILQLQTRLDNFQKNLKGYNVLASSSRR